MVLDACMNMCEGWECARMNDTLHAFLSIGAKPILDVHTCKEAKQAISRYVILDCDESFLTQAVGEVGGMGNDLGFG